MGEAPARVPGQPREGVDIGMHALGCLEGNDLPMEPDERLGGESRPDSGQGLADVVDGLVELGGSGRGIEVGP